MRSIHTRSWLGRFFLIAHDEWITCVFVMFLPREIRSSVIWYTKSLFWAIFFLSFARTCTGFSSWFIDDKWTMRNWTKKSANTASNGKGHARHKQIWYISICSDVSIDEWYILFACRSTIIQLNSRRASFPWHCFASKFRWFTVCLTFIPFMACLWMGAVLCRKINKTSSDETNKIHFIARKLTEPSQKQTSSNCNNWIIKLIFVFFRSFYYNWLKWRSPLQSTYILSYEENAVII